MSQEKNSSSVVKSTKFSLGSFGRIFKNPILIKIGLILVGLIMISLLTYLFFNVRYGQVVYPHTFIGQTDFGSKTISQVKEILGSSSAQVADKKITIKSGEKSFELSVSDLGVKYDTDKTSELIWSAGRKGNVAKIIAEQIKSVFGKNQYSAIFDFNQDVLKNKVEEFAKTVDQPEENATISIKDLQPEVKDEKVGKRLNQDKTKTLVLQSVGSFLLNNEIVAPVEEAKPQIYRAGAEQLVDQVKKILEQKIVLEAQKKEYNLSPSDFADWLIFTPTQSSGLTKDWSLKIDVNKSEVEKYVKTIASEIDQEAKDAKFNMGKDKASAFQIAQTGYKVNQDESVKLVIDAILKQESKVKLPVEVVEPKIKSNSAEELGIKEVVGQATTHFYNSPTNRRRNIAVGAKALHGIVVAPGEEFSTIGNISPVNAANGYLPELVIKEDGTKAEYGGGLCQVSSTLFRAALNAGLEITERTNHSYRVPYYEPPIGMDATIYEPRPDFKFVNNMSHPILIQSSVDNDNSAITFTFYGTKDGRKVEMTTPVAYGYTNPPDPIYTEDPSLAPGEIKQVDHAHAGAKADFKYKVTLNGKVLQNTNFHSDYVAWAAKFLYGPGTQIPPAN